MRSTDTINAEEGKAKDHDDDEDDDDETGEVSGSENGDDDEDGATSFKSDTEHGATGGMETESAAYSSEVVQVTHQRSFRTEATGTVQNPEAGALEVDAPEDEVPEAGVLETETSEALIVPETIVVEESNDIDLQTAAPPTGAETASEIFRHLQATRDKDEVTAELAKILNVLESTLQREDDESEDDDDGGADEDSDDSSDSGREEEETQKPLGTEHESTQPTTLAPSPKVTKKPPKHPNPRSTNEGERAKSGKEEMGILSKILVTLLCSCKSTAASGELRRVIRQFRDAAREATDEVGEDIKGRSSRARAKRSLRHREGVHKFTRTFPYDNLNTSLLLFMYSCR